MFNSSIIKNLIDIIKNWSIPSKLLFSAVIGAFAGSGFIGFVVEFATYRFSLAYGFRPPVEGIPYLSAIISIGSFILLLSGALIAAFAVRFMISMRFRNYKNYESSNEKIVFPRGLLILIGGPICAIVLGVFLYDSCYSEVTSRCTEAALIGGSSLIAGLAGSVISSLATFRPASIWWVSGTSIVIYYIAFVAFIFTPPSYAYILRYIGFGGGLPITLDVEMERDKAPLEVKAYLMVRSSAALIIFTNENNTFYEYSLDRIARITYSAGGFQNLPYKLPPNSASDR